MMSKIRKMQDTWLAKSIFILTALSFMSLFGISGYINSAGQNRTVIKVDDIEISQSEISYKYDKQLQMARDIFGNQLELTDEMRNQILLGIVRAELVDAIIKTTAENNNVVIGDDLVRKIIYSQAAFMNGQGKFDINRFRLALSQYGLTEQEYISSLRLDLQKRILAYDPAQNVNVPAFLTDFLGKIENQKRVFKYVKIDPEKLKIDRAISEDELQQYYHDFSDNFMAPEKRDISYVMISADEIAGQYQPSQDEINEYYNANITLFETPEKRSVLQMVFQDEDAALKARADLDAGKDFNAVARTAANQTDEDTNLGDVDKDALIEGIGDDVFALPKGGIAGPLKSEFGWHIMKVTAITPAKKMNRKEAEKIATEAVRKEKAYDVVYYFTQEIEDKIGGGETLENLAKDLKASVKHIKNLSEDGMADGAKSPYSIELVDQAFSYNVGEVSQVVETDTGLAVVRVDNVVDAHLLDLDEVKPMIEKMWADNERDIIAQELSNDMMNDLEEGGTIDDAAKRFGLKVMTSAPIKRSESFDELSSSAINSLFQLGEDAPKMIEIGSSKIIAVTAKIIKDNHKLTAAEADELKARTQQALSAEAANALIDNYAKGYDVRVKYKLLGLAD